MADQQDESDQVQYQALLDKHWELLELQVKSAARELENVVDELEKAEEIASELAVLNLLFELGGEEEDESRRVRIPLPSGHKPGSISADSFEEIGETIQTAEDNLEKLKDYCDTSPGDSGSSGQ